MSIQLPMTSEPCMINGCGRVSTSPYDIGNYVLTGRPEGDFTICPYHVRMILGRVADRDSLISGIRYSDIWDRALAFLPQYSNGTIQYLAKGGQDFRTIALEAAARERRERERVRLISRQTFGARGKGQYDKRVGDRTYTG